MDWFRWTIVAVVALGPVGCGDNGGLDSGVDGFPSSDGGRDDGATFDSITQGTTPRPTTGMGPGSSPTITATGTDGNRLCGNGQLDPGEQCDDGNQSNLDDCLTTCEVSRCTDGLQSGSESDVDCGGPCQACNLCQGCFGDQDCAEGLCGVEGICSLNFHIEIDWTQDCFLDSGQTTMIEDLPAGEYVAVTQPSAATVWAPPWNPPTTGFYYVIDCAGLTLDDLRSPPGTFYGTPNEAYNALMSNSQAFTWPGGPLACGRMDVNCEDNTGSIIFTIEGSDCG